MIKISSKLASTISFNSHKSLFCLLKHTFLTAQIKEIDKLEHLNGKKLYVPTKTFVSYILV